MPQNMAQEITALKRMSVAELRVRYAETFGERPGSGHRQWLLRRIAWRVQALANDADLRLTAPRTDNGAIASEATRLTVPSVIADNRLPMPGTLITRRYKGRTLVVEVLADGFAFEGKRFPSLSAVAKAATGAHWNGFYFFGQMHKATTT